MCDCNDGVVYKTDHNSVLMISKCPKCDQGKPWEETKVRIKAFLESEGKHEVIMRGASYDNYS